MYSYQQPVMQQNDYKNLGTKLVEYYYSVKNQNLSLLPTLFLNDSQVTFDGAESLGVNNLLSIHSMKQLKYTVSTTDIQPIDNDKLVIVTSGKVSENGSEFTNKKFSEFMFVVKNPTDCRYYIKSCIFRTMPLLSF
jgi:hypothetical protein